MAAEDGNPARLSPTNLTDIRETLFSLTIGLAELVAGAEIEDAKNFQGVQAAIANFVTARQLASKGDLQGAVDQYEEAFIEAAEALKKRVPGPSAQLPGQVSAVPKVFSTQTGRNFEVLTTVFGAKDLSSVVVSGAPPGMNTEISQLNPEVPVFVMSVDVGQAPPGTYTLSLTADDAVQGEAVQDVTVVVNPPPPPPVGGIVEDIPGVAGTAPAASGSSGPSAGVLAGVIAAGITAGAAALGGAAWYAKRRLLR